jgi:hypothetical protein
LSIAARANGGKNDQLGAWPKHSQCAGYGMARWTIGDPALLYSTEKRAQNQFKWGIYGADINSYSIW